MLGLTRLESVVIVSCRFLQEMSRDKGRLVQELDWLSKRTSGYEAVARTLKEQNTALNGQVCHSLYGGSSE